MRRGAAMACLTGPSRAGEDILHLDYPGYRVGTQWVARAVAISCTRCRPDLAHRRAAKPSPSGIAVLAVAGEAWLGILALEGCWRLACCPSPLRSPIELAHELEKLSPIARQKALVSTMSSRRSPLSHFDMKD
jgi:hypothetical protein